MTMYNVNVFAFTSANPQNYHNTPQFPLANLLASFSSLFRFLVFHEIQ